MKNYYRLLRNHKYPTRFLVAKLLMLTGACRWLTIRQRGYRLWFHNSNVAMYRWIAPTEHDQDLEFFRAYLKPGDRVVDVGANIGETVLTESLAVGDSGRVIAFEPHPRTFRILRQNLELNRICNVEAHNIGIGDKAEFVSFSDNKRDDMNRVEDNAHGLQVRIERLDQFLPQLPQVQLMKVDVEGYEKFVFAGAPELLEHTECVYFEVSTTHFGWFGYTTRELLEVLAQAGFLLFRVIEPGCLGRIGISFESTHFENLVALRDLAAFQMRSGWRIESQ